MNSAVTKTSQQEDNDGHIPFTCDSLVIGIWRRICISTNDLLCTYNLEERLIRYQIAETGCHYRIEFPFDSIIGINFNSTDAFTGLLSFDINRCPVFYVETTSGWTECRDFTEKGQASLCFHHTMKGSLHALQNQLNSLTQSDSHLDQVLKQSGKTSTILNPKTALALSEFGGHFRRSSCPESPFSNIPTNTSLQVNAGINTSSTQARRTVSLPSEHLDSNLMSSLAGYFGGMNQPLGMSYIQSLNIKEESEMEQPKVNNTTSEPQSTPSNTSENENNNESMQQGNNVTMVSSPLVSAMPLDTTVQSAEQEEQLRSFQFNFTVDPNTATTSTTTTSTTAPTSTAASNADTESSTSTVVMSSNASDTSSSNSSDTCVTPDSTTNPSPEATVDTIITSSNVDSASHYTLNTTQISKPSAELSLNTATQDYFTGFYDTNMSLCSPISTIPLTVSE